MSETPGTIKAVAEAAAQADDVTVAPPATVEKPVLVKTEEGGRVTLAYPEGRPEAIAISPEMLDAIVDDLNAFRALAEAQQTALAAYALGNRPGGKVLEAIRVGQQRFGIL